LIDRALVLELDLEQGRTLFEPGTRVSGVAAWSASGASVPSGLELRLIWATRGPGGRDFTIVETIALGRPRAAERRPFIFTLPAAPYSFRGNLISLAWTLELVALPGEEKVLVELTVAPQARAIDLRSGDGAGAARP
jgi:hypothetical protein